jgi:transposase InsO family protein
VVVDKFTKFAHFLPLHHPFSAAHVAKVFIDNVYKLHGLPQSIVSDRDKVFTSKLCQELFTLANVQLRMSATYHPQSDEQIERVNQCLETYLRCFVHACSKKWIQWLSQAEFWYNTCMHSAIGVSPSEALCGHHPRVFGISVDDTSSAETLDEW